MSSSTISAIVIAVEFVLRAVCVYAILRVTLTLFSIRKAEKLEKERDAALTYVPEICRTCAWSASCKKDVLCFPCPEWKFCGKTIVEVYGDGDR
jgi:hypothetical protein